MEGEEILSKKAEGGENTKTNTNTNSKQNQTKAIQASRHKQTQASGREKNE